VYLCSFAHSSAIFKFAHSSNVPGLGGARTSGAWSGKFIHPVSKLERSYRSCDAAVATSPAESAVTRAYLKSPVLLASAKFTLERVRRVHMGILHRRILDT
jgi:hypothetical protein